MTWDELAIDLLKAARRNLDSHPRTAASRAYYAAHIALAKEREAHGYVPNRGSATQPHREQRRLIDGYLQHLGFNRIKELRRLFTRLYARRIDSDYVRRATVDRRIALESVRDASGVLNALKIKEVA